jgi:hypothetical protein
MKETNEASEVSLGKKKLYSFPIRIKYFFLFILIALLFWTFTLNGNYQRSNIMQFLGNIYSSSNETLNVTMKTLSNLRILTNLTQYTVLIDGVRYPTQVPLHKNVSIDFKRLDRSLTKKLILFYNTWFDDKGYSIGLGYRTPFNESGCPVTSCETTDDKRRLNESDFVITHMRDSLPIHLPSFRPKKSTMDFSTLRNYIAKSFDYF